MAEQLKLHNFTPDKINKNRCIHCPYLATNPVHRRAGQLIHGTVRPMKFG